MALISIQTILILVTLCSGVIREATSAAAQNLDDLSMTVAFLREGQTAGTGFFVRANHPFLVTAEHVANVLTVGSSITVRGTNDTPINLKLGDLISGGQQLIWEKHTENDVAVLRLSSVEPLGFSDKRFFPIQQVVSDEVAPPRDLVVTMMGFPVGLGTSGRFSSISTDGKTAGGLLRMRRFDNGRQATFFVSDRPSIGGFSGGPVFRMPGPVFRGSTWTIPGKGNPTIFVGLVHGTIGDNGGTLAAIVPAKAVVATIKAAGGLPKSRCLESLNAAAGVHDQPRGQLLPWQKLIRMSQGIEILWPCISSRWWGL